MIGSNLSHNLKRLELVFGVLDDIYQKYILFAALLRIPVEYQISEEDVNTE